MAYSADILVIHGKHCHTFQCFPYIDIFVATYTILTLKET